MTPKISEAALGEFIAECQEMLDRLNQNLQLLEGSTEKREYIASIYRDIHTIKGSSQLFGFNQIAQLSHAMESCLDPIRKGLSPLTSPVVDIILKCLDVIGINLEAIKTSKEESPDSTLGASLIEMLINTVEKSLLSDNPPPDRQMGTKVPPPSGKPKVSAPPVQNPDSQQVPNNHINAVSHKATSANQNSPLKEKDVIETKAAFGIFEDEPLQIEPKASPSSGPPSTPSNISTEKVIELMPSVKNNLTHDVDTLENTKKSAENEIKKPISAEESSKQNLKHNPPINAPAKALPDDPQSETIRVNVSLLDNLMNLIGELVLIRNQVLEHAKARDDDQEFGKMSQRLNVLTAELQNEVMKTRMQPIGNVLTKFTRVVRDLGRELGKKIELELNGTDTELDKTILEAIKDPLTHIVRNAVDHGIESQTDRVKAKKPETGKIVIRAYHESGQVIIEVADDGGGIDRQKIVDHAIRKSVISRENALKLSDWEILHLIFTPGFSTANVVSNISGRGVGMDVVKTNVERIGGIVDIQSQLGVGTQIRLKIPLTLAIVPALLVKSSEHRFAIPQSRLVELLRIDSKNQEKDRIEEIQGKKVLRLRNRILPLVDLDEIIYEKPPGRIECKADTLNIVVLNSEKFVFGMVVTEIVDSTDIVVKPLSQFLKDINIFSGASIMGDGTVALTLDVTGIATTLHSNKSAFALKHDELDRKLEKSGYRSEICEFLTVDIGAPGHYAIPLTIVSRLEEIPRSQLEYSGSQRILRYREHLLPVISLPESLNFQNSNNLNNDYLKLIVVKRGEIFYGIEVHEILDIVSHEAKIDLAIKDRPGILGTLLANDRVIVIIDVLDVIDRYRKKLGQTKQFDDSSTEQNESKQKENITRKSGRKILVIDDSSFFRNHISQVLRDAGYKTDIACDGAEAFSRLEEDSSYDLVLSDIEMPVMDGIELVKKIRQNSSLKSIPTIALTTKFSKQYIDDGIKAGFNAYLEKLNTEILLESIEKYLSMKKVKEPIDAAKH